MKYTGFRDGIFVTPARFNAMKSKMTENMMMREYVDEDDDLIDT